MSSATVICLITDDRVHGVVCARQGRDWQVIAQATCECNTPGSLLADHDPDELAAAAAKTLGELGLADCRVSLVVPLQWVFTHVLETENRRVTESALLFDLEQYLPLPLEELTCDFLQIDDGHVLGAAIPTEPAHKLVEAIVRQGYEVDHISVDVLALLARNFEQDDLAGVLLLDRSRIRLALTSASPQSSDVAIIGLTDDVDLSQAISARLQCSRMEETERNGSWLVLDLPGRSSEDQIRDILCTQGDMVYSAADEAVGKIAVAASDRPQPDLCAGTLAGESRFDRVRKLTHHCLAGAIALTVVLFIGLLVHSSALRRHNAELYSAQLESYRQVFDADMLPPGGAMRLASQRKRLQGLTQTRRDDVPIRLLADRSPLQILREWVVALPEDVRVEILDVRLDENQCTIRGRTDEHRDAERIVEAINRVAGFEARPPRTTRLDDGGVEFSIVATRTRKHGTATKKTS